MNISFQATPINSVVIKETHRHWLFAPAKYVNATFVRLNPGESADVMAVQKVTDRFEKSFEQLRKKNQRFYSGCYAENIENNFHFIHKVPEMGTNAGFFALTTQLDNFDCMDSKKILAYVETFNDVLGDFFEIRYLQVDPLHTHTSKKTRKFKKIGSVMLDCIKSLFKGRNIFLQADAEVIRFYKRNGFKIIDENNMLYKAK